MFTWVQRLKLDRPTITLGNCCKHCGCYSSVDLNGFSCTKNWQTITCLKLYCTFYFSANINHPSFGNTTCVSKGQQVTLSWKFSYNISNISFRIWSFRKNSTSFLQQLYYITGDGDPISVGAHSSTNIEVRKPATLVIKNPNIDHNGTYQFDMILAVNDKPKPSNVLVIIKGKA